MARTRGVNLYMHSQKPQVIGSIGCHVSWVHRIEWNPIGIQTLQVVVSVLPSIGCHKNWIYHNEKKKGETTQTDGMRIRWDVDQMECGSDGMWIGWERIGWERKRRESKANKSDGT